MVGQPAAASPWSAPWQPGAPADTVLAKAGELPPVAELTERSAYTEFTARSEVYPSSLSGQLSRESSPCRSPLPGIGPPTPENLPEVSSTVASLLQNALGDRHYEHDHASVFSNDANGSGMQQLAPGANSHSFFAAEPQGAPRASANAYAPENAPLAPRAAASPIARASMNCMNTAENAHLGRQSAASPIARAGASCVPPSFAARANADCPGREGEICQNAFQNSPSAPADFPLHDSSLAAQPCARDYPNSPPAVRSTAAQQFPVGGSPMCSPPVYYPPSPAAPAAFARGNENKPMSPMRRKDNKHQQSSPKSMGAVPVLGPLPSLSLRRLK